jgi:hypothetical protein
MKPDPSSQSTLPAQFGFPIIEASSIGRTAYSRLKIAKEGTVHSVFKNAINILFEPGLVSLVPETVQKGPLNVTLRLPAELTSLYSLGLETGDKVKVQGSILEHGCHRLISFESAQIYSPKRKFTKPMLADDEIKANLEVMRKTALRFGNMVGIGELLDPTTMRNGQAATKKLNIFSSFASARIVRLEKAFRSGKEKALRDAVVELIGLGPGLTPSSDDMLAGLVLSCLLYAKNRWGAHPADPLIARAVAKEAHGRTTLLGEEYLQQAAVGRGNEAVMRACVALLTGGQESVERETRSVLEIGETSGTDTILGIFLGTMLCIGKKSSLYRGI